MSDPRRLILMRHAKAEPYAETDAGRALTGQGRLDAERAGAWIAAQGLAPTHALVSAATRAQETFEAARRGLGAVELGVSVRQDVYTASARTLLEVLREQPDEETCTLVVGHNPTVAEVAQSLEDGDGDPTALSALIRGFAPATVAVLEVPGSWADLAEAGARLVALRPGE